MATIFAICLNHKREWFYESMDKAVHALLQYFHTQGLLLDGHELKVNQGEVPTFDIVKSILLEAELFVISEDATQCIWVEEMALNPLVEFAYNLEHPL